jgi:hypothetical protein
MAGPIGTKDLAYQAVEPYQEGLTVKNVSGGSLSVGDLVYVTGTTTSPATGTDPVATVTKADADAAGAAKVASYVVTKAMANNAFGKVGKYLVARGINTSSYGVAGDPVYLSTTAGASTATAPTLGNVQIVGYVAVKSATVGIIVYNLNSNPVVSIGNLTGSAAAVTSDAAAGALSAANLAMPIRLSLTIPDGAGAPANIDFTSLPFKCRVRDVRIVKTSSAGGVGDTIRVANGATTNWITDAMSINVADQAIVRAASIDDAFYDLAAGATIRVARNKSSAANVACVVTLELDRVA